MGDYNQGAKHDDALDSLYGAVQLVEGIESLGFLIGVCCFICLIEYSLDNASLMK